MRAKILVVAMLAVLIGCNSTADVMVPDDPALSPPSGDQAPPPTEQPPPGPPQPEVPRFLTKRWFQYTDGGGQPLRGDAGRLIVEQVYVGVEPDMNGFGEYTGQLIVREASLSGFIACPAFDPPRPPPPPPPGVPPPPPPPPPPMLLLPITAFCGREPIVNNKAGCGVLNLTFAFEPAPDDPLSLSVVRIEWDASLFCADHITIVLP